MTRGILEMTDCTKCDGTGFLNIDKVPEWVVVVSNQRADVGIILKWVKDTTGHDVRMCDCCSDGEGWYGTPGGHYSEDDPAGADGPYLYNGGLCECH